MAALTNLDNLTKYFPSPLKWLPLVGWVLLACGLLVFTTRWGIGTSPDSAIYIGTANNLLASRGLTTLLGDSPGKLLVHYPPLYPLVLAAAGLMGNDLLETARWLHVGLFTANLVVAWLLLGKLAPQTIWLPGLALFPLAISNTMLTLHFMAWSEPLFLLFGFAGLYLLSSGLGSNKPSLLILSGFLAGLSALTRYAGFAFVIATVAATVLLTAGDLRRKLAWGVLTGIPGVVLMGSWLVYTRITASDLSIRSLTFHPPGFDHLRQGLNTLAGWLLLPAQAPGWLKALILVAIVAFVAFAMIYFRKGVKSKEMLTSRTAASVLMVFIGSYVGFLLLSLTLVDANTPLDERILSPLLFAGLGILTYTLGLSLPINKPYYPGFVALLVTGALLYTTTSLLRSASAFVENSIYGIGFSHQHWRDSAIIAEVDRLPEKTIIYTNSPEGIYLHTQRSVLDLPRKMDAIRQRANPEYADQIQSLKTQVICGGALVVYFTAVQSTTLPSPAELQAFNAWTDQVDFEDGFILGNH